ncbi:MAG TPA: phosphotransferase, partial [Chroococcales cyanobacterium]
MREPPLNLDDAALQISLQEHYGISASYLEFLPLGHDSGAWVYRAESRDGKEYFVKVRKALTNAASLVVPRFLQDHGVTQVVAPLPSNTGELHAGAGSYALIVYPYLHAEPARQCGLTDKQWIEYGRILRQVHDSNPTSELKSIIASETFKAPGTESIAGLKEAISQIDRDDKIGMEFAAFWNSKRETIDNLVARTEALESKLKSQAPRLNLCHADIHTSNVLVDRDGQLWFVDWDDVVMAPRERDLMFVV